MGDITWQALWDGKEGPIAVRCNVQKFPAFYVIDATGIIRERDPANLSEVVERMLK